MEALSVGVDKGGNRSVNICVFGSSSSGNCTFFWNDHRGVLIDCGLSHRYVTQQLRALGLSWDAVSALLITHTHTDHIDPGATRAIMHAGIPVLCPESVAGALARESRMFQKALNSGHLRPVGSESFTAGPFDVESFAVPHDAPGGCYGYTVYERDLFGFRKVTMATDIGFPKPDLVDRFKNSSAMIVESNHDVIMLENSGRPAWLKRRIREIGHLSNDQCAEFVADVVAGSRVRPGAVVLAHISQQCNTNEHAVRSTRAALSMRGFDDIRIVETFRRRPSEVVGV